ncbi:MAG: imidazole glycerol phosphate synthase subunit HisH [SAR324 cluster bacterium]|nr:imidazole glycerol phosphate synthase subunit HisH [SAR324 cluster bacterium]
MIAVIDYRIGNLYNLKNALDKIDASSKIVTSPKELARAKKIIIPGVSSFDVAMRNFKHYGFYEKIIEIAHTGIPILGVCVGMQILFSIGEENTTTKGLNLIKGQVKKFTIPFKIPHMGWNQLSFTKDDNHLLSGLENGAWVYFVHSYFVETSAQFSIATTDYQQTFCSVCAHKNIYGLQFHPEKSQKNGLKILSNFCFNKD